MKLENNTFLKDIELIYEYICSECCGNIYYTVERNRRIFLRIRNAVDTLYENAKYQVLRNKIVETDEFPDLTLQTTREILIQIYTAITQPDFAPNVEQKIRDDLQKFNINPDKLLVLHQWQLDDPLTAALFNTLKYVD